MNMGTVFGSLLGYLTGDSMADDSVVYRESWSASSDRLDGNGVREVAAARQYDDAVMCCGEFDQSVRIFLAPCHFLSLMRHFWFSGTIERTRGGLRAIRIAKQREEAIKNALADGENDERMREGLRAIRIAKEKEKAISKASAGCENDDLTPILGFVKNDVGDECANSPIFSATTRRQNDESMSKFKWGPKTRVTKEKGTAAVAATGESDEEVMRNGEFIEIMTYLALNGTSNV